MAGILSRKDLQEIGIIEHPEGSTIIAEILIIDGIRMIMKEKGVDHPIGGMKAIRVVVQEMVEIQIEGTGQNGSQFGQFVQIGEIMRKKSTPILAAIVMRIKVIVLAEQIAEANQIRFPIGGIQTIGLEKEESGEIAQIVLRGRPIVDGGKEIGGKSLETVLKVEGELFGH